MPPIRLDESAVDVLQRYHWSGNVRQLRNVAEQLSVLETVREITGPKLESYLPKQGSQLPQIVGGARGDGDFSNEREILYKVLFDMKSDLNDLKKLTLELLKNDSSKVQENHSGLIRKIYGRDEEEIEFEPSVSVLPAQNSMRENLPVADDNYDFAETVEEEETLRLEHKEIEMIKKALQKNKGKRKAAANELGISERTLYRKIKQFDLD